MVPEVSPFPAMFDLPIGYHLGTLYLKNRIFFVRQKKHQKIFWDDELRQISPKNP